MAFVCHLDWYPLNLKQLRQREKKWRSSFSPFQQILQAKKCPRKDACRYFGVLTQGPMAYKHGIPWVKWLLKLIPQSLLYKLAFASKDDTSKPPYLPISSKVFCLWYVRPVLPAWSQRQRLWVRTPSAGIEPVSSRKHCHRLTDGESLPLHGSFKMAFRSTLLLNQWSWWWLKSFYKRHQLRFVVSCILYRCCSQIDVLSTVVPSWSITFAGAFLFPLPEFSASHNLAFLGSLAKCPNDWDYNYI